MERTIYSRGTTLLTFGVAMDRHASPISSLFCLSCPARHRICAPDTTVANRVIGRIDLKTHPVDTILSQEIKASCGDLNELFL